MTRIEADDAPEALLAALAWQLEAGVDEAICETPQDRFAEGARAKAEAEARRAAAGGGGAGPAARTTTAQAAAPSASAPQRPRAAATPDEAQAEAMGEARALAAAASDLAALEAAVRGFERCALREGARQAVFADGRPDAPVMVVGEAPGRDEDREGKPFVGRAGGLLDRMMAAIGLDRRAGRA